MASGHHLDDEDDFEGDVPGNQSGLPIGALLEFKLKLNELGIWSGMLIGTLTQTVVLLLITFRTKWQKEENSKHTYPLINHHQTLIQGSALVQLKYFASHLWRPSKLQLGLQTLIPRE
ncbi:protein DETOXIFICATION 33-like [Canna indica]|uniref:Protein DETOXIFICATION 33-like n=1 Tax=Canna indica TaxID=4628 RepID=A0AAQ3K2C1_9LILI|nr:protein DETOXIFICATION 33-like [Canna indica]